MSSHSNLINMKITILNDSIIRYLDCYTNEAKYSNKPVLVMLHGLGASAERWVETIPILAPHYRLIIPDIIGFGYSDKPLIEYTMPFFVNFLQKFLKNLKISKPVIIGSSFGGLLAIEYALKTKDLEKLILVSPAGFTKRPTPEFKNYLTAAMFPTYENVSHAFREMSFDPKKVSDKNNKEFINRMQYPNSKHSFMSTVMGIKHNPPLKERISKISVPTLLIWGRHDRILPVYYSRKCKIPGIKTVIIDHCGHTPHVEKPGEFCSHVLKFLKQDQPIIKKIKIRERKKI